MKDHSQFISDQVLTAMWVAPDIDIDRPGFWDWIRVRCAAEAFGNSVLAIYEDVDDAKRNGEYYAEFSCELRDLLV